MTVSMYLSSIADAISNISISGVTVRDKDQIAGSWASMANVLYPFPDDFITGFEVQYDSILEGTAAPMTLRYTLNYRFLGVQVGDIGTWGADYSATLDKVVLIVNAMIATHAPYDGRVRMKAGGISVGQRDDPSGNQFIGADIALEIEEIQN